MSKSFHQVAPHYDLLMSHVPYDMWVGYYQLLLAQLGVDHRLLLDVCCGTGTVASLLAAERYEVVGLDLSENMICEARRRWPKIEFVVADAVNFDLGRKFEGAYSFFDSLNYITDYPDLVSAINCVASHLVPGGSFVFDVNTAYAFEKRMFDQSELKSNAPIRYAWKGDYDSETRLIRVDMRFERDGIKFEETHLQRAHSVEEIVAALEIAGFGSPLAYDSYSLQPPRARSDRLHFACLKL